MELVGIAIEVVSESNREHDLQTKRLEYARAGIPEYWIVDPQAQQITILSLSGDSYPQAPAIAAGDRAASRFVAGFAIDVASVFTAQ